MAGSSRSNQYSQWRERHCESSIPSTLRKDSFIVSERSLMPLGDSTMTENHDDDSGETNSTSSSNSTTSSTRRENERLRLEIERMRRNEDARNERQRLEIERLRNENARLRSNASSSAASRSSSNGSRDRNDVNESDQHPQNGDNHSHDEQGSESTRSSTRRENERLRYENSQIRSQLAALQGNFETLLQSMQTMPNAAPVPDIVEVEVFLPPESGSSKNDSNEPDQPPQNGDNHSHGEQSSQSTRSRTRRENEWLRSENERLRSQLAVMEGNIATLLQSLETSSVPNSTPVPDMVEVKVFHPADSDSSNDNHSYGEDCSQVQVLQATRSGGGFSKVNKVLIGAALVGVAGLTYYYWPVIREAAAMAIAAARTALVNRASKVRKLVVAGKEYIVRIVRVVTDKVFV